MRSYYGTFYENEGEIIWVNVHYELDPYHRNRDEEAEMWRLEVHHYQSGDITEYVPENWIEMFDKMARIHSKEKEEYFDHWYERTSDYHQGKISAHRITKMLQSGYDLKKIIEDLATGLDECYGKLIGKISLQPPAPFYISPADLTIEQLQQLIDLKKAKP